MSRSKGVCVSGLLTSRRLRCVRKTILSLLACLPPALAYAVDPNALPTGGAVANGAASISQAGARLNVQQQSGRAIINWNTFNIGSQASVNFKQPATTSVVLNRVSAGGGVSEIYGSVTANGQVFLVNPSGTIFGRGAQVNVGGLVASSLDITNTDFLNGNYRFAGNGTAGSILNQGTLNAAAGGYIALLAPQVRNEGVIAAQLGTVAIGAGNAVTLDLSGTGLVSMQVDQGAIDALIANRNLVQADGGVVLMSARAAGQLAGGVINNSGEIHAARVTERDGVIRLEAGDVANSGSIVADGASGGIVTLLADSTAINSGLISARGSEGRGGEARLLGDKVGLFGAGKLDASGEAGGGTVLVGGNYQGMGPEKNASMAYVGPNASIRANAGTNGDGGKVIVWSDDLTTFAGTLQARGGSASGNGGFAEVSGKYSLDFSPKAVDLRAANGTVGTLLLDPMNIIVATGGGAVYTDVSTFGAQPGTTQTIDPATLDAVGATVDLQATNDITVTNAINLTTPSAGLFAQAGNNINVNASITTNGGFINLSARNPGGAQTAGGTANINAVLTTNGGAILVGNNGGTNPIVLGANVNAGAGTVGFQNPVTLTSSVAVTGISIGFSGTLDGANSLTANSTGNTIFGAAVGGTTALTSLTTNAGGTTAINGGSVTTTGAQSYGDNVTLGAATTLASTGSGNVTLSGTLNGAQTLAVNTAGTTTFTGAVGNTTALTSLTTNATGTTAINGGSVATTGIQTYGDVVTLGAAATFTGTNATFSAGLNGNANDVTLSFTGTTTLNGLTNVNNLVTNNGGTTDLAGTISTVGSQTYTDAVTLSAATTLTSTGNQAISLNNTVDGAQTLAVNTTGTTTFGGAVGGTTALTSLTTNAGGTTAVNGGSVRTTAAQTYGDTVTLGAATTITGVGNTFSGTVNGAQALTVNDSGTTTFTGAVGGTTALTSLTTDVVGNTAINGGSVTTTGAQSYGDAVTLGAGTTLTGVGISFGTTTVNGAQTLSVIDSGTTVFLGAVGNVTPLTSLTTNAGGTTALVGSVTTTGAQNYGDNVLVSSAITLTSTGSGNLTFSGTVDGGQTLAVNTSGATTFSGAIGSVSALTSLTTDAGGTTAINGGSVTTTGAQTYGDAVTLGAATTLTGVGISFANTVGGAQTLAVNDSASTFFNGSVGSAISPLTSLTTNPGGSTFVRDVATTGSQTYSDTLSTNGTYTTTNSPFLAAASTTLGGPTLISLGSGNATFTGPINGPNTMTVLTTGNATFGGQIGAVTALTSLNTNGGGTTALNGGPVTTTGSQIYGALNLGVGTVLTGVGITFNSTVNGAQSLTVNDSGTSVFNGVVGGVTPLLTLTTNSGGSTNVNTGAITTTLTQNYGDNVFLGSGTTTLAATNIGGGITINGSMNTLGNLNLTAGGAITELGSGLVNASGALTTVSGSGQTLIGTNSVGTLNATNNVSGNIVFTHGANPLTISGINQAGGGQIQVVAGGTLNTTGAVTMNGTALSLSSAGAMTIGANVTGANGSNVTLRVTGADTLLNHTAGTISTLGLGLLALQADKMALTGGTITAGLGGVMLAPTTAGKGVDLGSTIDTSPNTLELSNAELATVNAGNVLQIGNCSGGCGSVTTVASGAIKVTAPVTVTTGMSLISNSGGILINDVLNGAPQGLVLNSGSTISETGLGRVNSTGGLTAFSVGGQSLNGANTIGAFSATNSGSGAIGLVNTAPTLTISAITQTAPSGSLTISNTGNLTTAGLIATSSGNVALTATNGTETIGGTINSLGGSVSLAATGAASDLLVNAGINSNAGTITSTAGRDITYTGSTTATTSTLNATAGRDIKVLGGTSFVQLSAGTMNLTAANDLRIQGGTGTNAFAEVLATNIQNVTINVGGNVTLNPGSGSGARIGSPLANLAGGNIAVNAGGSIALNDSATQGTAILTQGNVALQAASISEGTSGLSRIVANALTTNSTAGATALATIAVGSLNATSTGGPLTLGQGTVSGALVANSNGNAITQTGALTVGGTANITAGAAPIALTSANDFQGVVTLSNSGANAVAITDINSIAFNNQTMGGAFTVNAPTIIALDTTNTGDQLWNGNVTFNSTETTNGGNFIVTGTLTLGNNTVINTAGGNVILTGAVSTGAFPLAVGSTGTVSILGPASLGSLASPVVFTVTPAGLVLAQPISFVFASPSIPATLVFAPGASVSGFIGGATTAVVLQSNAAQLVAPLAQSVPAQSAQVVATIPPEVPATSPTSASNTVATAANAAAAAPASTTSTVSAPEAGTVRPTASSGVSKDTIRQIDQQISQARTQLFSPALTQLAKDPGVADVPACGATGQGICVKEGKARKAGLAIEAEPVIKRRVALLFGNDRYLAPIPNLETPIHDVEDIGKVLKDHLGYEVRVVKNATKDDIVNELNRLVTEVDEDDSVFVYYAGHGYQAEKGGAGYWIPVDATNNDASGWISNTAISKFLSSMAARQLILLSDSCYSGTLAQEQKVTTSESTVFDRKEILRKRSVLVMSSGGNEPVADGGHDNHSLFAYHLLRSLSEVQGDLVGGDIHERVRTAVMKEYPQDPQYGAVVSAGHVQGGEYLIEKK